MTRSVYRKLPQNDSNPREIAEVVNNLVEGKSNNTGTITLATGNATTTTLYDERIGGNSVILLMPFSASAANAASNTAPFGSWEDSTTQSVASITTAYPITFNTVDMSEGITLQSSSQFKVSYSGIYNVQFSLQLSSLDVATQDVDIWFRVNGTDIPKSNSIFGLAPRKTSTDPYHIVAALNYFASLNANDYIQVMWRASSLTVTIQAIAAQTSPTRPATPSAILTMNYISGDGFSSNLFGGVYVQSTSKGSAVISHPANTVSGKTYRYLVVA